MTIRCTRRSLFVALSEIVGVVPGRTPKEILKSVKIEAASGVAALVVSDGEITVRRELDAKAYGDTAQLVHARGLLRLLESLPDGPLTIDGTEGNVALVAECGAFHFANAFDPGDFPDAPTFTAKASHVFPGEPFRAAIRRTIFATDVESTRYALGGVMVDIQGERASLVATDSRRLAVCDVPVARKGKPTDSAPIGPQKTMALLSGLPADEFQIAASGTEITVRAGQSVIRSRLVEGKFPKYRDVIPHEFAVTASIPASSVKTIACWTAALSAEEVRGVSCSFSPGAMKLDSRCADKGESSITVPLTCDGELSEIVFDVRFLADYLTTIPPDATVTIRMNDNESMAALIAAPDHLHLLMPLSRDQ